MKSPHTITQFCNEVWLALHEPEPTFFSKEWGLCPNFKIWAIERLNPEETWELEYKLHSKFQNKFPFNSETNPYAEEEDKFKNKKRLYWIYSHTRGIPMKELGDVSSYEAPPQVASIGNRFCIIGTEYGHIHRADGTIRTWQTAPAEKKFLKQYCYSQEEMKNV